MRSAAGSQVAQHGREPSPDRVFLVARSLREVAAEEVRVVDVLGFKTLPAGSAIVVGDLLAHMEEITGESGVDAFVAYAEKVSSGELAA